MNNNNPNEANKASITCKVSNFIANLNAGFVSILYGAKAVDLTNSIIKSSNEIQGGIVENPKALECAISQVAKNDLPKNIALGVIIGSAAIYNAGLSIHDYKNDHLPHTKPTKFMSFITHAITIGSVLCYLDLSNPYISNVANIPSMSPLELLLAVGVPITASVAGAVAIGSALVGGRHK